MTDREIIMLNSFYKMYNENEYNFDTLYNKQIFLSKPSAFNDPFDCFVAINEIEFIGLYMAKKLEELDAPKNIIDEVKSGNLSSLRYADLCRNTSGLFKKDEVKDMTGLDQNKIIKIFYADWEKEAKNLLSKYRDKINEIRDKFYIVCFTKNSPTKNMVMWSHYANNYKGLSVEFNFGNIKYDLHKDRIDTRGYLLLKNMHYVKYSKKFITLNTKELFNTPIDELSKNRKIMSLIKKSLYKKHEQWRYEQELRIVLSEKELDDIGEYKILPNGCLLNFPYLRKLFIHKRINKYTIKPAVENLAKKLNIKYLILKDANGAIILEEDDEINEHNLDIDFRNFAELSEDSNDKEILPL